MGEKTEGRKILIDGREFIPTKKLHTGEGDGRRFDEMPKPIAPGLNRDDLATLMTLFTINPWVHAAVSRISSAVSSIRRVFLKDGKRVKPKDSFLGRLFQEPNPFPQTFDDLLELTAVDLSIVGWSVWEKILDKDGNVGGIYRLRPDLVEIIPDEINYWKGILFHRSKTDAEPVKLLPDEVIMFRTWNPINDFAPVSGLMAASGSATWDLFARTWNTSVFRNGALPEVVFKSKVRLNDETRERIKTTIKNMIGSPETWRDILILDDNIELVPFSKSPRDLEFDAMMTKARDEMLAALKTPPAMVGVAISGGLGGFKEQRHQFYQLTILPMLRKIESTINRFLAPPDEEFRFDLNDVLSLVEDLDAMSARAERLVGRGIMTINETRDEMGLEPVFWGQTWQAPLGLAPVEATGRPARPEGLGTPASPNTAKEAGELPSGLEDCSLRTELVKAAVGNVRRRMSRKIAGAYISAFDELKKEILARFRSQVVGSEVAKAEGDPPSPEEEARGAALPTDFKAITEEEFQRIVGGALEKTIVEQGDVAGRAAAQALGVSFGSVVEAPLFVAALESWRKARLGSTARTVTTRLQEAIKEIDVKNLSADKAIRQVEDALDKILTDRVDDLSVSDATTFSTSAIEVQGVGTFTHKQWISAQLPETRRRSPGPNHGDIHPTGMHQAIVPIGKTFKVRNRSGGFDSMSGPGDASGMAENSSFCACTLALLTQEEAEALSQFFQ